MKSLRTAIAILLLVCGVGVTLFGIYTVATRGADLLFIAIWMPATVALLTAPIVLGWPRVTRATRISAAVVLVLAIAAAVYYFVQLRALPMS